MLIAILHKEKKALSKVLLGLFLLWGGTGLAQEHSSRLNEGWEFLKGDLGGIWEAVRPVKIGSPESVPLWDTVSLPHTYNRYDAVDPDKNYYQGPAWYRQNIAIENPFEDGRTLLHFEGSGQKTKVYIDTVLVGTHVG